MNVILVRHGPAEDMCDRSACRCDAARRLTAPGRDRVRAAAQRLRELGICPPRWASSPLLRAVETTEILAEVLKPGSPFIRLQALNLDGPLPDLFSWLNEHAGQDALLVGHQPDLAAFASVCLCGQMGLPLHLKKAGVGILRSIGPILPGHARLEAWLPPPGTCQA